MAVTNCRCGGTVMPQATGPDRAGLHKSSSKPFDESDIYMSTKQADGTWSEPVNLGFNGAFGDSSGMEINSGNTFVWLRGNGVTNDIVYANKNSDGSWGAPVSVSANVNDHTAGVVQGNPHISPDGKALWKDSFVDRSLLNDEMRFQSHRIESWVNHT